MRLHIGEKIREQKAMLISGKKYRPLIEAVSYTHLHMKQIIMSVSSLLNGTMTLLLLK